MQCTRAYRAPASDVNSVILCGKLPLKCIGVALGTTCFLLPFQALCSAKSLLFLLLLLGLGAVFPAFEGGGGGGGGGSSLSV